MIIPRQKFFSDGSDRNSEWWKRKIAEERKKNPNSPRIKKWESVLQYTLEKEGKADPKKAQEAASRAAQGHSAYSGRQSGGSGSSYSQWGSSDDFFKNWWENSKKNYEEGQRKWEGRREQDKKEWGQRKAQAEFDKKRYMDESSKIREDIRRKFNKKNYTGGTFKNFRRGVTIMAGVAVPVAAYSAYRSKKSRDKWKETQKSYSSKTKSDKYYQGEETNYQKKNRENMNRIIVGSGVGLGGKLGANLAGNKVTDAFARVGRSFDAEERARSAYFKNLDPDKMLNISFDYLKDKNNADRARMNYVRRLSKLETKAAIRGGLKGAAIGGTIGGLAAYAYNNSAKTRNEKANVKKRKK